MRIPIINLLDELPNKNDRFYLINKYLLILLLFTILSIVMTYPLAFSMSQKLPGGGDILQVVSTFWMTEKMLSNIGTNLNIFHTFYLFYPTGIQLVPGTVYNQVLALIVEPILGTMMTCNILYLSAFILSGFGAYLLAMHVTGNDAASMVAGIVYAFAPFHFAHAYAGHLGSVTMQWIPFCTLFIIRTFEKKDFNDAIVAGLFFILVSMSDLQYMVFMAVFIALYVIYGLIAGTIKIERKSLALLLVFGIIGLVGVMPFTFDMLRTALSSSNYLSPESGEAVFFSNDLLSFFIPAYFHPVFGQFAAINFFNNTPAGQATPWEITAYAGVSVLLLSLYAFVKDKSKERIFWALSAIFFALLSMGPILHIDGISSFFGMQIPMPYALVSMIVPGLSNSRTPGRFDVIVVLSLSVLVAIALSTIYKNIRQSSIGNKNLVNATITIVIAGIIIFEYLAIPFTMTKPEVPSFYYGLANETGNFAIMEIPATTNYYAGVYAEYYQTIHHKPIVGGQVARTPPDARDFEDNTPFVRQLTYQTNDTGDIFEQNITDIGSSVLQHYNIRYVLVHNDYLTDIQRQTITGFLNSSPGLETIKTQDSNLTVYQVINSTPKLFMVPQDGWYSVEKWDDNYNRWISNNGTLLVDSPTSAYYNLSFAVMSVYGNRTLRVYANGQNVYEGVEAPSLTMITVPIRLNKGSNAIVLNAPDGTLRPCDTPGLNSTDIRAISFAVRDMTIRRSN